MGTACGKGEVEVAKDEDMTDSRYRSTGRSTGMHQRAQAIPVDRPVDRLTRLCSRAGAVDRRSRPGLGPVDRQTDPSRFRISVLNWNECN